MDLIDDICTTLGVLPADIGISKYADRRAYTYREVISAFLPTSSTEAVAMSLGLKHATLEKYLQRNWVFEIKRLPKEYWSTFLLRIIQRKYCQGCDNILPEAEYYIATTRTRGIQPLCTACEREKSSNYYSNNTEKVLTASKRYYESNIEKVRARHRDYAKEHSLEYNARAAKRRAAKLQRTPSWANLDKIKEIYRTCPEGYHVDHIVPLQGELVSGLHVENNLQHLPASENLAKGNTFIVQ